MAEFSAWRVNDVVAYDLMGESALALTALLARAAISDSRMSDPVRLELAQLQHDILTVDGYDRVAVSALAERIAARIRELSGVSP